MTEERVQARIGAGQVTLHSLEDTQRSAAHGHDGMFTAAPWPPPPAGVS